jgi:hypothetical protein
MTSTSSTPPDSSEFSSTRLERRPKLVASRECGSVCERR